MAKKKYFILTLSLLLLDSLIIAQQAKPTLQPTRQDTLKGSITPERKWWDVLYYDLSVQPFYTSKMIAGKNVIRYKVVQTLHSNKMQIDLQTPLSIDSVFLNNRKLSFTKEGDAWFIDMPEQKNQSVHEVIVYYSGKPKESINAPWDGGLIWTKDSLGRPWTSVACQLVGASVWYPCKVHQSDEPDLGASVSLIVPDTLVGVSNGRLQKKTVDHDGTVTYKWTVINPINNYGISFYIGKYIDIPDTLQGEGGKLDMDYWVLDYNKSKAETYLPFEVHHTLHVFENWFGAYPFYKDGFKMVEAPYIGMEHQSAIAYGNHFMHGRYGAKKITYWDTKVDRMVSHEIAHEWFGNSITVKDVADRWVHEGFAGYAEELAMEDFYGKEAADEFFHDRTRYKTDSVMVSDVPLISDYNIFKDAGEGMYIQGWVLVHMIRAIMDDDVKFKALLRGLNSRFYHQTVTSKQVEEYIDSVSGQNFSKLFDEYLRTPQLPIFEYTIQDGILQYQLTNCIPDLTIPIKTNLTGEKWIYASTQRQKLLDDNIHANESLKINKDFYLQTKRLNNDKRFIKEQPLTYACCHSG